MSKKPRENRIPIMMSDEELTAIDDWRFASRVATRSEAVRRLCQIALHLDTVIPRVTGQAKSMIEMDLLWRENLAEQPVDPADRISIYEAHLETLRAEHMRLLRETGILGEIRLAISKGDTLEGAMAFASQVEKRMDDLFEKAKSTGEDQG